jgi:predicted DNA-binding transcriptional regulator AlpA
VSAQVDPTALAGHLEALAHAAQLVAQDLRSGLADLSHGAPSAPVTLPAPATDLLEAHEFAARLRINIRTLRRWRLEGRVPKPLRGKGPLRWDRTSVEQWLQERAA